MWRGFPNTGERSIFIWRESESIFAERRADAAGVSGGTECGNGVGGFVCAGESAGIADSKRI